MLPPPRERTPCIIVFFICAAIHLVSSSIGLTNSLFEIHEFRQLQTALTARSIVEDGWQLAYHTPLFGPPWSVPFEFPLYQVCVAAIARLSHLSLEPTGRLVGLAFFYLSLPACFGLAGFAGLPPARRWLALALLLTVPCYLYYSRAFMIESTALCASTWFLFTYLRGLDERSPRFLGLAAAFGVAAGVVKVTTFLPVLIIAAAWVLHRLCRSATGGIRDRLRLGLIALLTVVPSCVAAIAWVRYSDAVKAANPLAAGFTSTGLQEFNFGSFAQRFTGDFWSRIYLHTSIAAMPVFNLCLLGIFGLLLGRKLRPAAFFLVGAFVTGPLIFANLYFVHDYYFYATAFFLAGALALAWSEILDNPHFSFGARWLLIAVSLGVQLASYAYFYFPAQRHGISTPPEVGRLLETITQPDDVLLVFGEKWHPRIPYTAHRRAVMVLDEHVDHPAAINAVLGRLPAGTVTALVASGPTRNNPAYFKPLVAQLDLLPEPLLINPEMMVYVSRSRADYAAAQLTKNPPVTFRVAAPSTDGDAGVPRTRYIIASVSDRRPFTGMHPLPVEVMHPFGLDAPEVDGKTTFNAHAPTDVIFELPPHATSAEVAFGILPGAYGGTNFTPGVEFRVEWVGADGIHHPVTSVFLSPSLRPEDRGEKTARIRLPAEASGRLWFRALPGPTGSIACCWAYWSKIDIR